MAFPRTRPLGFGHVSRGFSLLEVIIATGIMATSSVLLLSLLSTGDQHAQRAETRGLALMLCQTKLDALLADPQHLREVKNEPLFGHEGWQYSVNWQPLEVPGLIRIRVSVQQTVAGQPFKTPTGASKSFELVRWARIPNSESHLLPAIESMNLSPLTDQP